MDFWLHNGHCNFDHPRSGLEENNSMYCMLSIPQGFSGLAVKIGGDETAATRLNHQQFLDPEANNVLARRFGEA